MYRSFTESAISPDNFYSSTHQLLPNITSTKYRLMMLSIAIKLVVLLTNQKDYEHVKQKDDRMAVGKSGVLLYAVASKERKMSLGPCGGGRCVY